MQQSRENYLRIHCASRDNCCHQITEGAPRYEGVTRLRGLATGAAPSEELEPPRQEKVISQKHVKGITAAVFLGFLGFPN